MDVLVATAILISGACHRAQSSAPQPKVEPPVQASQRRDEEEARRFAGVDIVPTRSGFMIRVHSGMVGDGDPLYVIDGAPIRIPRNGSINWFKPEDIADIKVLKAPYELAEYGPNGVNGVIVITTRQAPRHRR